VRHACARAFTSSCCEPDQQLAEAADDTRRSIVPTVVLVHGAGVRIALSAL